MRIGEGRIWERGSEVRVKAKGEGENLRDGVGLEGRMKA